MVLPGPDTAGGAPLQEASDPYRREEPESRHFSILGPSLRCFSLFAEFRLVKRALTGPLVRRGLQVRSGPLKFTKQGRIDLLCAGVLLPSRASTKFSPQPRLYPK